MLSSLAPARRRVLLALLAAAVVAALAIAIGVAVSHRSAPAARAAAQDAPGPVLLVPGYGGSTTSLQPLADALRAAGKTVQIVGLPDNARGDLSAQARTLDDAARAELARSGARSVDVVGYSAGGVVARLWARDDGGGALARRIVTLGSPQHGTELAALGQLVPAACPTACQQLAPDSDVLAALNAGDETPDGPRWVSVWTTHDDVVLPPDSASLAGATNITVQSVCPADDVDHGGLPGDPTVQRIVIAALAVQLGRAAPGCGTPSGS